MGKDCVKHLRAYKYRIYPNKQQEECLAKTFGSVRFIWNKMLNEKLSIWEEAGHIPQVTPAEYKKEYSWLYEVDSLALANTQLNLEKAFRNYIKNPKKFELPSFKKKINEQGFTTNNVGNNIKANFKKGTVKIPKLDMPIKVKFHRNFEGNIKSVTIRKNSSERYYVSILIEESIESLKPLCSACGIDVGLKSFATITQGNWMYKERLNISNPKYLEKTERILTRLQHKLSRKQKSSHNREKYRLKPAKLYERIANQRMDFLHKVFSVVIHENQVIITEDLNVQGMLKNHHLAKSISSVSWSTFINMLKYKTDWYGRELVAVDIFSASTQNCSICGYKNSILKDLSIREWTCPLCCTPP
jgi:putative transposase